MSAPPRQPKGVPAAILIAASLLLSLPLAESAAQQAPAAPPAIGISGVLFTHFRYGGEPDERSQSRFDVERAYLNFRAALGERLGVRVTADVFQQTDPERDDYYGGWAIRAKYAYLQYDFLEGDDAPLGMNASATLGIIGTVIVGHVDEFWPRWISKSPVDRYGLMSSADAGAGVELASAGGRAELYATVTNGEGYQRGEVDRFKDYSARLSLRPFAGTTAWPSRLVISPWGSIGSRGSAFVEGAGTVLPVARGLGRDMAGVFAAYRGRAAILGAEYAARFDETESADTLVDLQPTFGSRARRIASGFVVAKPLALLDSASRSPLGVVFRYDYLTNSTAPDGYGSTIIAGLTWELSSRVAVALDYQGETPHDGFPGDDTRTWYLHAVARF